MVVLLPSLHSQSIVRFSLGTRTRTASLFPALQNAKQDADASPPNAPATVTPVSTNPSITSSSVPTSAAARLNLPGNAKPPSAAELLLKKAPETAAMSEKMKEALAEKPDLINVVDDGLFYRKKQISPEQECFPKNFEDLVHYIEVGRRLLVVATRGWVDDASGGGWWWQHHVDRQLVLIDPRRPRLHYTTNHSSIQHTDCVLLHLEPSRNTLDNPYRMDWQINVTHPIIIQGNAVNQTFIDCFDAVRCFRVMVRFPLAPRRGFRSSSPEREMSWQLITPKNRSTQPWELQSVKSSTRTNRNHALTPKHTGRGPLDDALRGDQPGHGGVPGGRPLPRGHPHHADRRGGVHTSLLKCLGVCGSIDRPLSAWLCG